MVFSLLVHITVVVVRIFAQQNDAASIFISKQRNCRIHPLLQVAEADDVAEGLDGIQDAVGAAESLDEAVAFVNARPKPLALYLFTTDKAAERRVLRDCSFGGGCINDTIIHLATSDMGFGGVGESGMGSYHGKLSFDTFTHYKSIVKKSNRLDLPVRYQPYTKEKERMLRRVLK